MFKLIILGLIFINSGQLNIERIITPKTKPKDRIAITKEYKNITVELKGDEVALIKTNKGEFKVELYVKDAPKTVENFVKLSLLGFYDGLIFHRYVENFVIQGGDPTGTGFYGCGYNIPLEISDKKHVKGALGVARTKDPNSGSSQFYITLSPTSHLDGKYTVFGRVIEGMDVVMKLRKGDRIEKIEIIHKSDKQN